MTFEQWLQSRLTAHGYPCGPIDGDIGNLTIAAIKAFQRGVRIAESGMADPATVTALKRSASNQPDQAPRPSGTPTGLTAAQGPWPHESEVERFYGAVGTSQGRLELPFPMHLAWDRRRTVRSISLHKKVLSSAGRVFAEVSETYNAKERTELGLNIFSGSLNVRRKRRGSEYSMHSWGVAIDFDDQRNRLMQKSPNARLSHDDAIPFWEAWEREGWISLGRSSNFDWMHVQAAKL